MLMSRETSSPPCYASILFHVVLIVFEMSETKIIRTVLKKIIPCFGLLNCLV